MSRRAKGTSACGRVGWGLAELEEERDDGVEDDALGGEQFAHVANELFGGDVGACGVLPLQRGDGKLALGGGFHQGGEVVISH